MNFFKTITNSIYSPEFYKTLPKKSFQSSFGYFFLLILLITTVKAITLINPLVVQLPGELSSITNSFVNCFPRDLEVKIINGEVKTNVEEPYLIPYCSSDKNLVMIDTKNPFSPEKQAELNVSIWVTKDSVFFKKNDYETRSYSLKEVKDLTVNQASVKVLSEKISPYFKFVGPVLLVFVCIGLYLGYTFRLVYLLFIALLIMLISKITKQKFSFGQSYKVSMYAITFGLLAELTLGITHRWTNLDGFPFMVTIFTLTAVFLNLLLPKRS